MMKNFACECFLIQISFGFENKNVKLYGSYRAKPAMIIPSNLST